jgi:hypothetical protein
MLHGGLMTIPGTVQNGVVVLGGGQTLPEGAAVDVIFVPAAASQAEGESTPSIWEKLYQLGKEAESRPCDLPEDLAINHDFYLHGQPKRQ